MEARVRLELAREVEGEDEGVHVPAGGLAILDDAGEDRDTLAEVDLDMPADKVEPQAAARLRIRAVLPAEGDGLAVRDRHLTKPALLVALGALELVLILRVGASKQDATVPRVRQVEEVEELPPLQVLLERQKLADEGTGHALQTSVLIREHVHERELIAGHFLPLYGSTSPLGNI